MSNIDFVTENWKDVVGYEGYYEVSDCGRVRSIDRVVEYFDSARLKTVRVPVPGIDLKLRRTNYQGYDRLKCLDVTLSREGAKSTQRVHTLVMAAFVGPRPVGLDIAHNDSDPSNNHLSNLRYTTAKDNCADRVANGTAPIGEQNPSAKLRAVDVIAIRAMRDTTAAVIATRYGVSKDTIHDVVQRRTWSHIA